MSVDEHKALIRRLFEEFDRQNLAIMDELCAPGYVAHFPGTPGPLSREAAGPVWSQFFEAFPALRHEVEDLLAQGDRAAARLRIHGVHEGELMGMPPTGRAISIGGINFYRFENGKLAEHWIDYDALGMLQQLGAIPAPAQAEA